MIESKCCCNNDNSIRKEKNLEIVWQRLLVDGNTCPRCSSTETELEKAVSKLRKALSYVGIKVILHKKELSLSEFKNAPLKSNEILINNKLLEEYFQAKTGKSQCCDVCGPTDCRTIEIEKETFEAIPEKLIIKAALLAAVELF
ncbi:MAG: DUF2703 domain-containing protein [Chitinispirillaceae bacterium]|nr:DUF2703 domain-containing protein [Chitinispirillaceae bacterium]